jgi:two-component system, LuxR family, sensor kinase FixL
MKKKASRSPARGAPDAAADVSSEQASRSPPPHVSVAPGSSRRRRRLDAGRVTELEAELERLRAALADQPLRESEARLADQKESLELAVSGAPTSAVLEVLVRAGRRQLGEDARTAVSMVDRDCARLRFAATDGMPEHYVQAADGFPIGPQSPSCGSAAHTGEVVIVGDVAVDPLWAPFLEAARQYEIRACWSFPIRSSSGKVLGTFAVYHRTPRQPHARDRERIALLIQTAAVIIEHHNDQLLRREAEADLRQTADRLQAILNTASDAIITIRHDGLIDEVNPATERMFGYPRDELVGRNINLLMPPPFCDEHDDYIARYLQTGQLRLIGIGRELVGRRKDGSTFPIDLSVSQADHLQRFTGIVRDISERKSLEEQLLHIAEAEQRRIGEDLHDDVGQELTGLALTVDTLTEALDSTGSPEAELSRGLGRRIAAILRKVRFLSHGLVPVDVDGAGLMASLEALAASAGQISGPTCSFACPEPVLVDDNRTATQLYRIAQEAVTNAIRHARASTVEISLEREDAGLILRIRDDGIGISDDALRGDGMGLRIMQHRAGLLNTRLTLARSPGGGTLVECAVPAMERTRGRPKPGASAGA